MSAAADVIERTAFSTSRLLDFVSEKELTLQCGYPAEEWPLVVVKELVDNALDACEEQGIAPEITVTVTDSSITVADNGVGIPPDIVDRLLDFSIRVSSREAYVAPDRGAQGNALKTIVAMPFVLDGAEGRVDIAGGGVLSEISFCVDRIQQSPVADVTRTETAESFVRVHWPHSEDHPATNLAVTGYETNGAPRYLQELWRETVRSRFGSMVGVLQGFVVLNPHLTLHIDLFGERQAVFSATNPEWRKWRPSSPTSPHWYEPEHLERLIGAYITHDLRVGRPERTVREFVSGFKGLTSTIKQKQLLAELGLARAPLSSLVDGRDFDHEGVAHLLAVMKAHTKPVRPAALGAIGRDHIKGVFERVKGGIRAGSFEYKRVTSLEDGLPQVTEVAFAALNDHRVRRQLFTGVNWSAAWINPFRQLGGLGRSLDTMLSAQRFDREQPIVVLVHVAHPRVQYADRGKSTVVTR